jgi:hypothetical protein
MPASRQQAVAIPSHEPLGSRAAGLVLGLVALAVSASFLAGIAVGSAGWDHQPTGSRTVPVPRPQRTLRSAGAEEFTIYLVGDDSAHRLLLGALTEPPPPASWMVLTVPDEHAEAGAASTALELDTIRREAGLPEVRVLDLRVE